LTRGQWRTAGGDGRYHDSDPSWPANGLSHGDALNFCEGRNQLAGRPLYRLPREAEWEAACRAGGDGLELAPERLEEAAWVRANSGGTIHPVAGRRPNKFGFFDMLGNVYEWCQETYDPRICPGRLEGDPRGPTRGLYKVLRGGSFNSLAATARCGWRFFFTPTTRHPENGCRLVREAVPLQPGERAMGPAPRPPAKSD
ncbi:MAG: formylglycine-generating enzyme family protein, partial [Deltaproteobacteria bacterium]|nr:formylglycine-generating enzyme family protein [Deltaproteobacteria bacterium]